MPKVSGSVTLWFEDIEFDDDGELSIRDQAFDALKDEVLSSSGEVVEVQIDSVQDAPDPPSSTPPQEP